MSRDSSWRTQINPTNFTAGLMVCIGFVALGASIIYWWDATGDSAWSVLIAGMGAFGTLILASATFISVRQSRRSVSELEKERQKPIAKDEIVKVIQPAIDAIKANAERLDSESGMSWVYSLPNMYNPHIRSGRVSSAFADPAPVAMVRFQDERPDLWSQLKDHEELIKEMIQLADEIQDRMEGPIQICVTELDWKMPKSEDEVDVRMVINAAIKELEEFGESSSYYEFWEDHGEDITELTQSLASEELKKLESAESQFAKICETLSDDLANYKVELQQEYGISESTIDDEVEQWPTIL